MNDSHGLQDIVSPLYYGVPDTPQAGVPHTVVPVYFLTDRPPNASRTVLSVVLELAQAGGH